MELTNYLILKSKIVVRIDTSGVVKQTISSLFKAEEFSVENGVLKSPLLEDFDLSKYQVGIPLMIKVHNDLYVETYLSRYIEGIIELMYIESINTDKASDYLKKSIHNIKESTKRKINTLGSSDCSMCGLEFARLFRVGKKWYSGISGMPAFILGESELRGLDTDLSQRTTLLSIDYSKIPNEALNQVKASVDKIFMSYLAPILRVCELSDVDIKSSHSKIVSDYLRSNPNYGYALSRPLAKLRHIRFGSMSELVDRADEIQNKLILDSDASFDKIHEYDNLNTFLFGAIGKHDVGNIALLDIDFVTVAFHFKEISGFDHSLIGSYSFTEFIGLCEQIGGSIQLENDDVTVSRDGKTIKFEVQNPSIKEFINSYKDAEWANEYSRALRSLIIIGYNLEHSSIQDLMKDYYVFA